MIIIILQILSIVISIIILATLFNAVEDYNKYIKKKIYPLESQENFGIPIIKITQKEQEFYFVVDTGANNSVINIHNLDLFDHIKLNVKGSVYGMEGNATPVEYIRSTFNILNDNFIDEFQIIDMSQCFGLSKDLYGIVISGILGSEFLKRYSLSVDLKNNVLYKI